jgi:peptide/nickel transport system permease protein
MTTPPGIETPIGSPFATTDGVVPEARRRSRRLWRIRRSVLSWVGIAMAGLLILLACIGPWIVPHPEAGQASVDVAQALKPPSGAHWFGTDDLGRDVFSRVILATRVSLLSGLVVVIAGSAIGIVVGLVGGYLAGGTNVVLMRIADVFLAVPGVALALAFAAALRPSLTTTIVAITLVWWPWMARLVQAEVLSVRTSAFVEASRTYGASHVRILFRDILPNISSVIVVKMSLDVGFAILMVAALGFLGAGVQAPTPEWGAMIAAGRAFLPTDWWISTFPGIAIFIAVLGFNLLGDALRDVLDVSQEV